MSEDPTNTETTANIPGRIGDIGWAVDAMRRGEKIRRVDWPKDAYIELQKTNWGMHLHGSTPERSTYLFCDVSNLLAEDWEIF
jgi:hypothetical protein